MADCDLCIGDPGGLDETFEFCSVSLPKSRKQHRCCECGQEIPPGDKYERAVGVYEGRFHQYRTCLLCVEIRKVFTCGNSWYYEMLWDEMTDLVFPALTTQHKCFGKLSIEAREFILARWRKWKGVD